MTKIKFRFHNKPLSDEHIHSHQNFDGLMTAFAVAPQPSLQYRLLHNRFFIYTTGIMSGIIITTIATLFIFKTETTQLAQTQNTISTSKNYEVVAQNNFEENSSTTFSKNISEKENNFSNENSSNEKITVGNIVKEKKSSSEKTVNAGFSSSNPAETNVPTVVVSNDPIMDEGHIELVSSDSQRQVFTWQPSEGNVEQIQSDNSSQSDETSSSNFQISTSSNQQLDDSSKKKLSDVTAQVENKIVGISKNITDESKTSYAWTREKLNHIFASGNREKTVKMRDTVSFLNRPAQVSFLYPIGSNGISSGRYSNNFSLNILTGFNGGVNGCEIGGLVNVDRKNINGLQVGGLTNIAFGNLNGAQIGGLVNQSKSVNGAQIGGLVNSAIGSVKGTQIAGLVNFALDSIDGAQIGGIANISTTSKRMNGFQIGGIANLSLGKMNGSQISGIVNVANRINGMQISFINVGAKVHGSQIGFINISDSLSGIPIGFLSISRSGMFHLDLFSNDFSFANTCVRLGSDKFYNTFALGFSPNTSQGNRYSFGYGIGTYMDISKKFFMNIDALAWNIHYNNFNDWSSGINMVNQLRILPGWQITKGIGLYAGPCVNVEVIDDSYNSAVKTHLFSEHGGGSTGVNGWIGWTAGLQFF